VLFKTEEISMKRFQTLVSAAMLLPAVAAADPVAADTAYMFNTLFLLICGVLVMFMAAGFAMLEAGMVRSKSVAVILAKNISLYAIASIVFFVVGYELMYGESVSGLIGKFHIWGTAEIPGAPIDVSTGQASSANWFFQMVFVATAASVVSGALAERVKFWSFALFVVVLTGLIYPIVGHWTWGGGWLAAIGFTDFAGSTVVHSVGGWAALAGVILLGPRRGRFDEYGRTQSMPPSSLPIVTLGTFILWLGWFGFNGGSQLSFASPGDAVAVANIFVNTNAAAAGGVVAVVAASQAIYRRIDLTLVLNGALAGLVSITAEPLAPTIGQAVLIGAVGGLLMILATRVLERLLLDDVVGAIPVHLVGGVWGTFAVVLTNPNADVISQLAGITIVGAFTTIAAFSCWESIRFVMGIRLRSSHEEQGGDMTEVGMRAYNIGS
jgi:Amt family ammonium transporter